MLTTQAHLLYIGGHSAEGLCKLGVPIDSNHATRESACTVMQYLSKCSLAVTVQGQAEPCMQRVHEPPEP